MWFPKVSLGLNPALYQVMKLPRCLGRVRKPECCYSVKFNYQQIFLSIMKGALLSPRNPQDRNNILPQS